MICQHRCNSTAEVTNPGAMAQGPNSQVEENSFILHQLYLYNMPAGYTTVEKKQLLS